MLTRYRRRKRSPGKAAVGRLRCYAWPPWNPLPRLETSPYTSKHSKRLLHNNQTNLTTSQFTTFSNSIRGLTLHAALALHAPLEVPQYNRKRGQPNNVTYEQIFEAIHKYGKSTEYCLRFRLRIISGVLTRVGPKSILSHNSYLMSLLIISQARHVGLSFAQSEVSSARHRPSSYPAEARTWSQVKVVRGPRRSGSHALLPCICLTRVKRKAKVPASFD